MPTSHHKAFAPGVILMGLVEGAGAGDLWWYPYDGLWYLVKSTRKTTHVIQMVVKRRGADHGYPTAKVVNMRGAQ